MPTDDDKYILDTDASDLAIGAVLFQKQNWIGRVIAYASRSLDKREQIYCVTRSYTVTITVVHFLKYFEQYLLGQKFNPFMAMFQKWNIDIYSIVYTCGTRCIYYLPTDVFTIDIYAGFNQ